MDFSRTSTDESAKGFSELRAHADVNDGIHEEKELFQHLISKKKDGVRFEESAPVDGVENGEIYEPNPTCDPEEGCQLK